MAARSWKQIAVRGPVRAVGLISLQGQDRIVSGGDDMKVRIWDPATGDLLCQLDGHSRAVRGVATTVIDGRDVVVSCSDDRTIRTWDPDTCAEVRQFTGHSGRVVAVRRVTLPDGTEAIVSASADGTIRVWDPGSGEEVRRLTGHTGEVAALHSVMALPHDVHVVSGGYDGAVQMWSLDRAETIRTFPGHSGIVWAVAFALAPGREHIVSAGYDATCRVWDISTGKEVRQLGGHAGAVRAIDVLAGGDELLVVLADERGLVRICDPATGDEVRRFEHGRMVRALAVGSVGGQKRVVTGGDDGTIGLWDPSTGAGLVRSAAHTGRGTAVAAGPVAGRTVIVSAGRGDTSRFWDPATGDEIGDLASVVDDSRGVSMAVVVGRTVVLAADDERRPMWEPAIGDLVNTPTWKEVASAASTVVVAGDQVVTGGDAWVGLWRDYGRDVVYGSVLGGQEVRAVAFAHVDGRDRFVVGTDSGLIRQCDAETGGPVREWAGHDGPVTALAIATVDGRGVIVSAGADGTVRVWDPLSAEDIARLGGHTDAVLSLAVAGGPAGDRIVSAGADGTVRVWDPSRGLETQDPLLPHDGPVRSVTVCRDLVASIGDDGMLVVQPLEARLPTRPHTALLSDEASAQDQIGSSGLVAQALADFLLDPETQPPVTIGLKGAWGGGKTSTMLMIRELVDPLDTSGGRRRIPLLPGHGAASWAAKLVGRLSSRPSQLSAGEALEQAAYQADVPVHPDGLAPDPQRVWRPSVWFSPWHHQSGEQVWAGLATSIVDEVAGRMSTLDRERFFVRLNWARIDPAAVRRRVHGALWRQVAVALVCLAPGALFVAAMWGARWATGGFSVAVLATLGASLVTLARTPLSRLYPALVSNPAHARLSNLAGDAAGLLTAIRDPDHSSRLGYSYLAYVDLKRVIDLVATPQRPLVVFIDDLDRCSSNVMTQTLEALNLFLAGPFENCTFVMAIEPTVLAAHVASAYQPLGKDDQELGWRFLEKMVQVPVVVPRPTQEQASAFITNLLPKLDDRPDRARATDAPSLPATVVPLPLTVPTRQPSPTRLADAATDLVDNSELAGILDGGASTDVSRSEEAAGPQSHAPAQERFARSMASDPAFHDACVWAAQTLIPSLNPRQLKRLLAMIEVYALIANRLGYLALYTQKILTAQLREIGLLAALNVRWPHLVDRLLAPGTDDPHGPLVLDRLRRPELGSADADWLPADLREFLDEHSEALDMASRLTTLQPQPAQEAPIRQK